MKTAFTILVSFMIIFPQFSYSAFKDLSALQSFVDSHSQTLPECLFHWGSKKGSSQLTWFKEWNRWAYYFLSGDETSTMGKGLYISNDPNDSSQYGEKLTFVCQPELHSRFLNMELGEDKSMYFKFVNDLSKIGYDGAEDSPELFGDLKKIGISGVTNFTHSTWSVIFAPDSRFKLLNFEGFLTYVSGAPNFLKSLNSDQMQGLITAIEKSEGAAEASRFRELLKSAVNIDASAQLVDSNKVNSNPEFQNSEQCSKIF